MYRRTTNSLEFGRSMNLVRIVLLIVGIAWPLGEKLVQAGVSAADREPLVVHEWGTFTELQDESGTSIVGINTDDEPVPDFVHRIHHRLLENTVSLYPIVGLSKGIPFGNSQVRSRLETPILYFYPPRTYQQPMTVNVDVGYRGGWISEYYPEGEVDAPGLDTMELSPDNTSSLRWRDLRVGTAAELPQTDFDVWTTPRVSNAATVTTANGEAERYLFYRGVGNYDGPLEVLTDVSRNELTIRARTSDWRGADSLPFAWLWLVDVRRDGQLAYRQLRPTGETSSDLRMIATTERSFADTDYSIDRITALHESMHEALADSGLYVAEATAMLATWKRAYFQSPGIRLFYVVPREWVDNRLPLTIQAQDSETEVVVERVMIGRVELVAPWQRELIEAMKQQAVESSDWREQIPGAIDVAAILSGQTGFADVGVEVPRAYRRYLELGRFRNALLRHELTLRPSESLIAFSRQYGLATGPTAD